MQKRNKSFLFIISIYSIVAIAFIVIFIFLPYQKGPSSWIVFSEFLFSTLLSAFLSIVFFAKKFSLMSKLYRIPVARISYIYELLQFILTITICILDAFFEIPIWIPIIFGILIFVLSIIGILFTNKQKDVVEEVDDNIKENISNHQKIIELFFQTIEMCKDDDLKKELSDIKNKFQYSDPVSNEQTIPLEGEIMCKLGVLQNMFANGKREGAEDLINAVKNTVNKRSRISSYSK